MCSKSHRHLGKYLVNRYMTTASCYYQVAFLFGCFEPDWNPVTYIKGSLRFQWLRGHNYRNAYRYMRRIAHRLEKKKVLKLLDYYTLGKLIHYTADSFTYAHNDSFPPSLEAHREYEVNLQEYFLRYVQSDPRIDTQPAATIIDTIRYYHLKYEAREINVFKDATYAVTVCCCILTLLLTEPIP